MDMWYVYADGYHFKFSKWPPPNHKLGILSDYFCSYFIPLDMKAFICHFVKWQITILYPSGRFVNNSVFIAHPNQDKLINTCM